MEPGISPSTTVPRPPAGTGDLVLGRPPVKITKDGLLIRSFQGADAAEVYRACQDPAIQRWTLVPAPYLPADAQRFVTEIAPKALVNGSAAHLGVFDAQTGQLLGACGLDGIDTVTGTAEIGYWTAPWARGQAVATRACRIVASWGLHTLGLRRIGWWAMVGNHASRLVALRAGFRLDGLVRAARRNRDGEWVDAWVGSLLPRDLEPATGGAMTGRPLAQPTGPGCLESRRAAVFSSPQPVLTADAAGGPIRLRAPVAADIDPIVESCRDPESQRWTGLSPEYGRPDAEFFAGAYTRDRWSRAEGAVFAVTRPDDSYIGTAELRITPGSPTVADVGYLIAAQARGRGYAAAALRAMCAWGFTSLGLERIEWRAYVGNDASLRVAEKAGFTIEGVARSAVRQRDVWRDAWTGALLASDLSPPAPASATPEPATPEPGRCPGDR